jgi:hypothetical protein
MNELLPTIIGVTGIVVNLMAIFAVIAKGSRWSGVVDTKLADVIEHLRNLPCRGCVTFKQPKET